MLHDQISNLINDKQAVALEMKVKIIMKLNKAFEFLIYNLKMNKLVIC